MHRIVVMLLMVSGIVSCRKETGLGEREKQEVVQEVRAMMRQYYADVKKSGLTAEFDYLDRSDDFFWVPPGYGQAISYDSVAVVLNQNAGRYRVVDNTFDTLRITPLSLEIASYTAQINSTMTDTSGAIASLKLIESGVTVKRNGKWKLLNGQTSILK